ISRRQLAAARTGADSAHEGPERPRPAASLHADYVESLAPPCAARHRTAVVHDSHVACRRPSQCPPTEAPATLLDAGPLPTPRRTTLRARRPGPHAGTHAP